MDTVPRNGKRNRTATILPIKPGSDRGSTSSPYNGNASLDGNGNKDDASETRRRLTFTVEEAAFLLNISRGLAYELVARGEIGSIRLGRRIVIPRIVLEELTGSTTD